MITKEMLKKIAPNAKDIIIDNIVIYFNKHAHKYSVNNYLRVCHFFAQAAHESAHFKTLEEYATGAAYEGRKDLGNVKTGDGKKYKGRGMFQLTGRANYKAIGNKLGYDLENNPDLAKTPEISVLVALDYWDSRNLSKFADVDDIKTITKKINGGYNGLEDRINKLAKAKLAIPKNFKINIIDAVVVKKEELPQINNINIVLAKQGDKSEYIKDLQKMLIKKGFDIKADGDFGKKTEQAVWDFQKNNKLKETKVFDTETLLVLMS